MPPAALTEQCGPSSMAIAAGMETEITPIPNAASAVVATDITPPPTPLARLAALPARSKMMLAAGAAGLIAVFVALLLWQSRPDYRVLYANLSEKDGGAVIAQLATMNVPYKYAEGGGAILVPSDRVHDVRLKLASAGLPKGSIAGFELMDNARFGQTQFQERLTFQRGLEGELTRSILALGAVEAARVHLALPNQNGFFREQQKPSASVLLTVASGRALDRSQIAGIVHLVSSSVPELSPKAVSIIDQNGNLLSQSPDGSGQSLDEQQLQYVHQIESTYLKRVNELLEPLVGRDNLRATVTADIDFSQTESTAELFKPNQGPDAAAAVRSMQLSEQNSPNAQPPTGIPGASSNQPPVPASAPINGSAQAMQPTQMPGGAGAGAALRRDNVTNYEVDKTVRVTRNATGVIKRLTAAVVVNHRTTTNPAGKSTTVPLTEDEIGKLTSLVQESIGYSKDRGDSVKVVNAPFRVEPKADEPSVPLWKQEQVRTLVRDSGVPIALVVVALLMVFGLVRPALKAMKPPAPEKPVLEAVVDDPLQLPGIGPAVIEAPRSTEKLDAARAIAKQNPAAVANIVRDWASGGNAA